MGPAPPPAGTLSDISPLRLYYLAASSEQNGLLTFQLADRSIQVQFRKGNPEHVSSSHREDSIAEFLKAQKLLTDAQLKQAEAVIASFGNDLVGALFGLGILNPGNAFANLAEQALTVLLKAILAERGSFSYQDSGAPLKVMPLGNRWAVLTDVLRRVPLPEIKRRLKDDLDRPLSKSEGRVPIKDLPLTPQEIRAVNHLNGAHTLNELARHFPHDSDNLHRLVFMFRDLDLLSIVGGPAAAPEPAPAQPSAAWAAPAVSPPTVPRPSVAPGGPPPPVLTPARGVSIPAIPPRPEPARPAPPRLTPSSGSAVAPLESRPEPNPPPPVDSAGATAEIEELRALAKRFKNDNFFQILGVSEKVDAGGVKLAYIKLAKQYHPDTISVGTSPEVGKLKEEIFTSIGEAYRVLSDDRSRVNYLEIISSEGGEELLPLAQVLLAEETFQRGCNLVKAKRFPEALKMLDDAIRSSEDVAEFYAWRGYAKFFTIDDKKRAQAEANKDLQIAIQKSEFCSSAYYFLGQIAKLTGDMKAALKHFRKAVEIKPDHIDAKREVRLLTKR